MKEAVVDAAGAVTTPAVSINYGAFIQSVVDFIIIAFAIFMMVKAMNSLKKKEEAAPAAPLLRQKKKHCLLRSEIC
jgi:large conductance mechanosensitive channel